MIVNPNNEVACQMIEANIAKLACANNVRGITSFMGVPKDKLYNSSSMLSDIDMYPPKPKPKFTGGYAVGGDSTEWEKYIRGSIDFLTTGDDKIHNTNTHFNEVNTEVFGNTKGISLWT